MPSKIRGKGIFVGDAGCDGSDGDDRKTVLQRKGKNVRMNKLTTESNGPDGTGELPF